MKVAELTKPQIPQSFVQNKLNMAERDLQKAREEMTKLQEELDYWQGLITENVNG
jgi:predicted translin family RNA/ssDNA-binding protein